MPLLRQLALPVVASAGLLVWAAPAISKEQPIVVTAEGAHHEVVRRTVEFSDLNLATSAGATELDHRVRRAVDVVCHKPSAKSVGHEKDHYQACSKASWARARPKMEQAIAAAKAAHHK